jgi:starvation-inducible DNA-binding protein
LLDELTIYSPLPARDSAGLAAVSAMQKLLPELVALTLDAKQAHWNMTGPGFLGLHQLTDAMAVDGRAWADRLAERAVALGLHVDARPVTVAAAADSFPLGRVTDVEAALELIAAIERTLTTARRVLAEVAATDPVAHDITVQIIEGLEKYRWMLTAQTS